MNQGHREGTGKRIMVLGYSPSLKGGVTVVTRQLLQCVPNLQLLPILGSYGNHIRSAAFAIRALFRFLGHCVLGKVSGIIVIVASRGDVVRTIPFLTAARWFKLPVVIYFHKDLPKILRPSGMLRRLAVLLWSRSAALVFLSNRLACTAAYSFRLPRDKFRVIPNALEEQYRGVPRKRLEDRAVDVLFVGRWSPEKGRDDVVALFRSDRLGSRFKCVVYGADIDLGGEINIEFRGWARPDEIKCALSDARVLILPSYAEAYPLVLLEALACGTPFVSTNVAGIPDISERSGGGVISDPGNLTDLESAIASLLSDDERWERMSLAGHLWAQSQTMADMRKAWDDLIAEVFVSAA